MQVAVIIGEVIGHFANDAIMRITTSRNRGIFEAESRLWWVPVDVSYWGVALTARWRARGLIGHAT
jgi:hypothetical protein